MKKRFTEGFDSLLGGATGPQAPDPVPTPKVRRQTRRPGPEPKHPGPVVRATFILDPDQLVKFKAIAYWERKDISQQLRSVIAEFVRGYEKKHGAIDPIHPPKANRE